MARSITVLLILFCSFNTEGQSPLFQRIAPSSSGIDFNNAIEENESLNVLSYEYFYNGGGVAAGDINNDGLIDLYFTANMKPDKLFLNLGNLKFKDITKSSKVFSSTGWKTGVTMADVNADGFLDIYVCHSGNVKSERNNKLYINNGNLTFTESATQYGLADQGLSTQAAFFDFDNDGDLDVYVLNHNNKDYKDVELQSVKTMYDTLAADRLYRNDSGHFTDVSATAGISGNPLSFGLGISIADINSDGWQDIYVSNDYREYDYYYVNNRDGTFTNKIKESFQHISEFSMGNDVADFNNDGLADVLTLDMLPEDNHRQKVLQGPENYELHKTLVGNGFHYQYMRNMLQLNNGDGTFSEIGQLAGVSNTDWSWSPLFADFDNDGWKDLLITNGYLRDYTNRDFLKYWGSYLLNQAIKMEKALLMDLVKKMPSTLTKNYLFKNQRDLTFTNVTDAWGFADLAVSSGALYADLDNDGDLEIVINNVNESAFIFKNLSREKASTNYLQVQLKSGDANRFGIGSTVSLYSSGQLQVVDVQPARGYQSAVMPMAHFGLGTESKIDSLIIRWPDNTIQRVTDVAINQRLIVIKTRTSAPQAARATAPLLEVKQPGIQFRHKEYTYNDFKRQPLMPFMLSYQGPALAKADVNGDGLEDLFIGASRGEVSMVLIQHPLGEWKPASTAAFADKYFTATDAVFFDADNDKDPDLYLTSGMYHDYLPDNALLADRLFINDGKGEFTRSLSFPKIAGSKSCVRPHDIDGDGDLDLFIGGRVVAGSYPEAPVSFILQNDGKGNFADVTDHVAPSVKNIGMVTDASWTDLNKDGVGELVIVGEWMAITVLENRNGSLVDRSTDYFDQPLKGMWNTLLIDDLDGDGDPDMLVGNLGMNTQLRATPQQPAEMWYKDFDNNGSIDPFLSFYIQGKSYPFVSRDELLDQIITMRKKFTSYESYADATIREIFSAVDLKDAKRLEANTFETTLLINEDGKFKKHALPTEAQFSPVYSIVVTDVNNDARKDLLLFGNNNRSRLRIGKIDANFGCVLLNGGDGNYVYTRQSDAGLQVIGDVRDALEIKSGDERLLLIGVNGSGLVTYKIK